MNYQILIAGADLTSNLLEGSLTINKNLNTKNSMTLSIIKKETDSFFIAPGQEIKVISYGKVIYGGLIQKAPQKRMSKGSSKTLKIEITTMAYEQIVGRRTIEANWSNINAGQIVTDLVNNFLSQEGISIGQIDVGINISNYQARAKSIKNILDDLAEACGYQWWIDENKNLYFMEEPPLSAAPYNIEDNGVFTDFSDVVLDNNLSDYANKIFVLGKKQGGVQVLGTAEDTDEIARMASLYGTGVFGKVINNSNIETQEEANEVAQRILKTKSFIPITMAFKTRTPGFDIGQIYAAKLSEFFDISFYYTDFLIESVRIKDYKENLIYEIKARRYSYVDDTGKQEHWTDAFSDIANREPVNEYSSIYVTDTIKTTNLQDIVLNTSTYTEVTRLEVNVLEDLRNYIVLFNMFFTGSEFFEIALKVDGVVIKEFSGTYDGTVAIFHFLPTLTNGLHNISIEVKGNITIGYEKAEMGCLL